MQPVALFSKAAAAAVAAAVVQFARVTEWFSIRHCSAAAVNYLIAL